MTEKVTWSRNTITQSACVIENCYREMGNGQKKQTKTAPVTHKRATMKWKLLEHDTAVNGFKQDNRAAQKWCKMTTGADWMTPSREKRLQKRFTMTQNKHKEMQWPRMRTTGDNSAPSATQREPQSVKPLTLQPAHVSKQSVFAEWMRRETKVQKLITITENQCFKSGLIHRPERGLWRQIGEVRDVGKCCGCVRVCEGVDVTLPYLHCLVLLLSTCEELEVRPSALLVPGRNWGRTQTQQLLFKSIKYGRFKYLTTAWRFQGGNYIWGQTGNTL